MRILLRYRRPLQWLVALVALLFLTRVLADSWSEIQRQPFTVAPVPFTLSMLALLATLLISVLPWQWSVGWLGGRLSFTDSARIWFLSNVVRYVPGNIWQPMTMVVLARARGVDELRTATSVALNWMLSNLSGLLVAGAYWALDPLAPSQARLWLLLPIAALALLALHPALVGRALRLVSKVVRRGGDIRPLRFSQLLSLLMFHVVIWIFYGIAFAFFWSAFAPLDVRELPRLTGAFAGAYAIGFLSLLTPSGLGVREGALVIMLGGAHPVALVTLLALLSRVWLIVGELLCTALVLLLTRGRDA